MYRAAHSLKVTAFGASRRPCNLSARRRSIGSTPSETGRSIARLGEPDGVQRSDPHPARPTVQHEPENPVLGAVMRHAKVEPAAVGIHAGTLRLVHLE